MRISMCVIAHSDYAPKAQLPDTHKPLQAPCYVRGLELYLLPPSATLLLDTKTTLNGIRQVYLTHSLTG